MNSCCVMEAAVTAGSRAQFVDFATEGKMIDPTHLLSLAVCGSVRVPDAARGFGSVKRPTVGRSSVFEGQRTYGFIGYVYIKTWVDKTGGGSEAI